MSLLNLGHVTQYPSLQPESALLQAYRHTWNPVRVQIDICSDMRPCQFSLTIGLRLVNDCNRPMMTLRFFEEPPHQRVPKDPESRETQRWTEVRTMFRMLRDILVNYPHPSHSYEFTHDSSIKAKFQQVIYLWYREQQRGLNEFVIESLRIQKKKTSQVRGDGLYIISDI